MARPCGNRRAENGRRESARRNALRHAGALQSHRTHGALHGGGYCSRRSARRSGDGGSESPQLRPGVRTSPRRRRLLRVVLDSKLRLSPKSSIVKISDEDLLVFAAVPVNSAKGRKLQDAGVEVIRAKTKNGRIDLPSVLAELGRREILSVLLEAGPTMNGAALAAGVVHKLFLFYAPKIAGKNRAPLALAPKLSLPPVRVVRTLQFGPDIAIEAYL